MKVQSLCRPIILMHGQEAKSLNRFTMIEVGSMSRGVGCCPRRMWGSGIGTCPSRKGNGTNPPGLNRSSGRDS